MSKNALPAVPPGDSGPPAPAGLYFSDQAIASIAKALVLIVAMIIAAWLIAHGFDPAPLAGAVKGKL